jgi:hypothetical protein
LECFRHLGPGALDELGLVAVEIGPDDVARAGIAISTLSSRRPGCLEHQTEDHVIER